MNPRRTSNVSISEWLFCGLLAWGVLALSAPHAQAQSADSGETVVKARPRVARIRRSPSRSLVPAAPPGIKTPPPAPATAPPPPPPPEVLKPASPQREINLSSSQRIGVGMIGADLRALKENMLPAEEVQKRLRSDLKMFAEGARSPSPEAFSRLAERLSQSVRTADTEKLDKTRMLGGVVAAMNPEAFRGDELNRALQGTRDSLSASGAAEADIQGLMDDLTGLAAEMRPKKETPPPKDDAAEKARKIPVYRGNAR